MDDQELYELFLNNLRTGIPGVESHGAGGYNAQNRQSTAAGKYQFTEYWLKRAGKDSIQNFVKGSTVFDPVNSMADFKRQPELQDAYFDYYAKNILFPEAKKMLGKNPSNFSIDEIGAIIHFQGASAAKKQISSGVLSPATKKGKDGKSVDNVSGARYLDKYNKTLSSFDLNKISQKETTPPKTKEEIINGFVKKEEEIDSLNISQGAKEKLRSKLYQELTDRGQRDIVNEYIQEQNKINKANHEQEVMDYKELVDLAEKIDINYFEGDAQKGTKRRFADNAFFVDWNSEDVEQREKLREKYDFFLNKKRKNFKDDGSATNYNNFIDQKKLFKVIEDKHHQLTGKKINISPGLGGEGNQGVIDTHNFSNFLAKLGTTNTRTGNIVFKDPSMKQIGEFKERPVIDPKVYKERPRAITSTKSTSSTPGTNKKTNGTSNRFGDVNADIKPIEDVPDNTAEEFFQRALGLGGVNKDDFALGETKEELPIDAITGLALGLIGNEKAKNAKIPLRTEEVSDAMKNYTAELAKRSKEGLPVELEAAMKGQLADAYQGGLENIVNASGGNRALVLGNQGQLEQAKNKGLIAIQVADYEAKERAFAQYGKAIEYINDFDARRDIANHGIEYNEAKEKQAIGRELATAGFGKLMDALAYQKENGPGSANDMYRSTLMQKMFGFDPKMKDDGTGDVQGTKSYFDKHKGLLSESLNETKALYERFGSLNPKQKQAMNVFMRDNTDSTKIAGFMDHLQQNPDEDFSNITMDNIDLAAKSNDYGLLSMDRNEALKASQVPDQPQTKVPNEIMLSPEEIENAQGGSEEPMGVLNAFPNNEEATIPGLATQPFNNQ